MSDTFDPSNFEQVHSIAVGGYRTYGLGVALLDNPEGTFHIHRNLIDEEQEYIVDQAKAFMMLGLSNVVKYSNPALAEEHRGRPSLDRLEGSFYDLLPYMRRTVDAAFVDEKFVKRMELYSPIFLELRPAPMCVEGIYKNICKSRKDKLKIHSLLMGIVPDERFSELVGESSVDPFIQTHAPVDLTDLSASEVDELHRYWSESGYPDHDNN